MYDFEIDAYDSIKQLTLSKIEKIKIQCPDDSVLTICQSIEDFLGIDFQPEDEMSHARHLEDLENLLELVGKFENTIPHERINWVRPLIRECYECCRIMYSDRIVLFVAAEKIDEYEVMPNALAALSVPSVRESLKKPLDIFVIPLEVDYDLSLISLVAHEVGHVLWAFDPRYKNRMAELRKSSPGDHFSEQVVDYIEEYFCDEVGRMLLGPAFDLAFAKRFALTCKANLDLQDMSETHPTEASRVVNCIGSLKDSCDKASKYREDFTEIIAYWDPLDLNNIRRSDEEEVAFGIAEQICEKLKLDTPYPSWNLEETFETVFAELDAFRPPFESVDENIPKVIGPREAVVTTTIYFYSCRYKKENKLYKKTTESKKNVRLSDLHPKKNEERDASEKVKKALVNHLQYTISLFHFVKNANDKYKRNFDREHLGKTLWPSRGKKRRTGSKEPFVVTPTTDPMVQYGPNSVDLRLGPYFLVHRPTKYTHIPSRKESQNVQIPIEAFYEQISVPIGEEFVLHPHQFVLASTLEYLCLPKAYYGLVLGRSTWGRLGLNIATATTVQAGFHGCLTLELRNLGESPLKLVIGARIAQICLIDVPRLEDESAEGSYLLDHPNSKYIGPTGPEIPKKIAEDADWNLLKF